jgi:zinc transport system substrate-binding protein
MTSIGNIKSLPSLGALLLLLFCLSPARGVGAAPVIDAFVSILPQKFLVESVAGERARVHVMVGPGRSPATYEPTPRQMAALAESRLYFRIGVPFEQVWMDRLHATAPNLTIVDTRKGITLRSIEDHIHEEGDRIIIEPANEKSAPKDPHIWTSPPLLARQARTIAAALIEVDPQGAATYTENLDLLVQRLEALDADLQRLLSPYAGRSFLVFHPSWGYFADRYGLRQLPIELGGKSPSARELGQIIDLARRENIGAVLVQKQFSRGTAQTVATASDGRLIEVDPLAEDVVENLRHIGETITEALME